MPKNTPRTPAPLKLSVSFPTRTTSARRLPVVPWPLVVVVGAGASVLLGWAALGAVIGLGALTAPSIPPATVLETVSQAWLGLHGVPYEVAGMELQAIPLGLVALVVAAMAVVGNVAVRRLPETRERPLRSAGLMIAACTAAYTLGAVVLASLAGSPESVPLAARGGALMALLGSAWGVVKSVRLPLERVPAWARALPGAIGAGVAALGGASAVVLAVTVVAHWSTVWSLQEALSTDAAGVILMSIINVVFSPNLLLWAGSYALGAGLTVGQGTLLTPWTAHVGALPGLPAAGALPVVPPVAGGVLLAVGPLSGALAGVLISRRLLKLQAAPLLWPWAWRGGLAGMLAGALWAALAWFSRVDLGHGRLVQMGPRFPELLALAPGALGAGGLLAALVMAVRERRRLEAFENQTVLVERLPEASDEADDAPDHEAPRDEDARARRNAVVSSAEGVRADPDNEDTERIAVAIPPNPVAQADGGVAEPSPYNDVDDVFHAFVKETSPDEPTVAFGRPAEGRSEGSVWAQWDRGE